MYNKLLGVLSLLLVYSISIHATEDKSLDLKIFAQPPSLLFLAAYSLAASDRDIDKANAPQETKNLVKAIRQILAPPQSKFGGFGYKKDFLFNLISDPEYKSDKKFQERLTHNLIFAAINGDKEVLELLLDRGANVNSRDEYGNTPLMKASQWGHLGLVKLLLERGADLALKNKYGKTALALASDNSRLDVARYLRSIINQNNVD